ncbi:hypothetical protein F5146DRAFT_1033434 [Armillaria mellea]|nr:hypothetical protein F5146DRAFT_1033434 [Armillaria mellea]
MPFLLLSALFLLSANATRSRPCGTRTVSAAPSGIIRSWASLHLRLQGGLDGRQPCTIMNCHLSPSAKMPFPFEREQ